MKKVVSCVVVALVAGIALADEVSPLEASIAKGAKFLHGRFQDLNSRAGS